LRDTGSGLDDLIYRHLIHSTRRYCWSTHFAVRRYTLGFLVSTSRILATDFITVCHFKSHMRFTLHRLIPFMPIFRNCQFQRLELIQFLCSQRYIAVGWRLETRLHWTTLFCWTIICNHFARTKQKTQPQLLRRSVYWSVA
jgi:hypothetical protein